MATSTQAATEAISRWMNHGRPVPRWVSREARRAFLYLAGQHLKRCSRCRYWVAAEARQALRQTYPGCPFINGCMCGDSPLSCVRPYRRKAEIAGYEWASLYYGCHAKAVQPELLRLLRRVCRD